MENKLREKINLVEKVEINNATSTLTFITIDYVSDENLRLYYNNIDLNSLRLVFKIEGNACSISSAGHIYISPYDKANDYKYYAMRGMRDLAKECGISIRKFRFKNEDDLINKIAKMSNEIFNCCLLYCGGIVDNLIKFHKGVIEKPLKEVYDLSKQEE